MKKYLKNIVSITLSVVLAFGFIQNSFVYADSVKSDNVVIKDLTDGNGNLFKLVETGKKGFFVIDVRTKQCIEYSEEASSPYLNKFGKLYYFGPMCYYTQDNSNFTHTISKQTANSLEVVNRQKEFKADLEKIDSNVSIEKLNEVEIKSIIDKLNSDKVRSRNSYIPNSEYIRDAVYPKNEDGTCGFTAACLILNYWNKVEGGYVPDEFLVNGNLKTYGDTLQDKLVSYGGSNSSWGKTVRDAINNLCSEYSLPGKARYRIGKLGIDSELSRKHRPAILFGWLPSNPSSAEYRNGSKGGVFHAVTVYGHSREFYICHYGWEGYEDVKIHYGVAGSSTLFNPHE